MTEDDLKILAKLIASKFISRPDVRAIQTSDGEYRPDRDKNGDGVVIAQRGFDMPALLAHLKGEATYGHYMLGAGDVTKLFVLDVDLEKTGKLPMGKFGDTLINWEDVNPREFWMTRQQGPGRDIIKHSLKLIAQELASFIAKKFTGVMPGVAYSGAKGIHVYGFLPEQMPAARARKAGQLVAEGCGWKLSRGNNFYKYTGKWTEWKDTDFHQFSLEVYPKQDTVQDLGNLVRLPLGVNRKSPADRAFFVDMRTALTEFGPMDPIEALTTSNLWADAQ